MLDQIEDEAEFTSGEIKAVDRETVHRICSGQVSELQFIELLFSIPIFTFTQTFKKKPTLRNCFR